MAVPSSTALVVQAPQLDTLWQAQLLCWVCERAPWTHVGQWHRTLLCAGCASNEPNPNEEERTHV